MKKTVVGVISYKKPEDKIAAKVVLLCKETYRRKANSLPPLVVVD